MSTPIPEGSVIITPTEVYREMQATHQAVQEVGTKVDMFVGTQQDHEARLRKVDGLPDDVKDLHTEVGGLNERVRKVEWRQGMWAGGAAVFAGSAGSLITWALSAHR